MNGATLMALPSILAILRQSASVANELLHSPLALPLVLAVAWRAYSRTLSASAAASAFLTSVVFTLLFGSPASTFVIDLQQAALAGAYAAAGPDAQSVAYIQEHIPQYALLSQRAVVFGTAAFLVLVAFAHERPWFESIVITAGVLLSLLALTGAWLLLQWKWVSWGGQSADPANEAQFERDIYTVLRLPATALGLAMTSIVSGCWIRTWVSRHADRLAVLFRHSAMERMMNLLTTVLVLVFAVVGFVWLPSKYSATMWLLFWIVAYPVALSFTRAKPLQGRSLLELYKAGLAQIPVLGKLFATVLAGDAGDTRPAPSGGLTHPRRVPRTGRKRQDTQRVADDERGRTGRGT